MIHEARRLEPGTRLAYDLCIIGAGAAGIALACELAGTGMRICLLESGGLRSEGESQALATAESVGHAYFPVEETRLRRVGGTTGWWSGECRPLDAVDLGPRPWLDLPGWPIGQAELAPWYARAQSLCELGPEPCDPAEAWLERMGAEPLPLDPRRFVTRIFRYSPPTEFARAYMATLRSAADVDLFLHATASAIEVDEGAGRVTAVTVRPLPAREVVIEGRLVVLAAGGIENARLLLASNRVRPHGLGNDRDQVGRCFMEHLFFDDAARLELADAWPQLRVYGRRGRVAGNAIKATLAPSAAVQDEARLLNCCVKLDHPAKRQPGLVAAMDLRRYLDNGFGRAHVARALRTMLADAPGTAGTLLRLVLERGETWNRQGASLHVDLVSEQAPDPDSRVTLSAQRDALGQPLPRLDWRIGEGDRTSWARALELLARELAAAGIGRLVLPGPEGRARAVEQIRGGRHHIGTTRMADHPARGVVDPDARVHGIDNLYIAGSSVFPSAGHANPTLTLLALALRLASHLEARWRQDSVTAARHPAQSLPSGVAQESRAPTTVSRPRSGVAATGSASSPAARR